MPPRWEDEYDPQPQFESLSLDELISLWQTDCPVAGDQQAIYFDTLAWLIVRERPLGVDFLITQLDHADLARLPSVISRIDDGSGLPPARRHNLLRQFLQEVDCPPVLSAAIKAMWRDGGDRTVRDLIERQVEHADPAVRRQATWYMAELFPIESVALVGRTLHDEDADVRSVALWAIWDYDDSTIVVPFLDRMWLLLEDEDRLVRFGARRCLWKHVFHLNMAAEVRPIGAATTERIRSARCLGYLTDAVYPSFLQMFDDPAAVVRLAAADCVSDLVENGEDRDDNWEADLARIWADAGDPLPRWLSDPDPRIRTVAQKIAYRLRDSADPTSY